MNTKKIVISDYLCNHCEHVVYPDEVYCPSCNKEINWDKATWYEEEIDRYREACNDAWANEPINQSESDMYE